jgi:hypothetical protein
VITANGERGVDNLEAVGRRATEVRATTVHSISADAPMFLSLCGALVSGPAPGVALRVAGAPVRVRAGDPAAGCPGNRFAGEVILTGNRAVTFGANIVSHSVAIDGSGPGNTWSKRTQFSAPSAAPATARRRPTAGQPNTAATKTGQCAAL